MMSWPTYDIMRTSQSHVEESLHIVYVPSGTCPSWCTWAHNTMEDLEERRRHQARERIQRYRRRLSDERRQYYSERRRLARQQQSDSLCSLMAHDLDRPQRTARHHSWETTQQLPTCSAWGTSCTCVYLHLWVCVTSYSIAVSDIHWQFNSIHWQYVSCESTHAVSRLIVPTTLLYKHLYYAQTLANSLALCATLTSFRSVKQVDRFI